LLTETILAYAKVVKPIKMERASDEKYVERMGQQTGEIACVRGWHGLGRTVRDSQSVEESAL
jgi:hypothetical protein